MTTPTTTPTPGTITVALPDARPRPVRQFIAPRPGVLVVVSADGFVEAYSTPGCRVHIAQRLAVDSPEELLGESYLEGTLPAWAREIFLAWDLVAVRMPRALTAREEIERQAELSIVRECLRKDARHV